MNGIYTPRGGKHVEYITNQIVCKLAEVIKKKKKVDVKHAKLVRDSFTIPEDELQLLADTKKKCLKAGIDIKKSELIRIGISIVHGLGLSRIKKEKNMLQPIKTGRPKKAKPG